MFLSALLPVFGEGVLPFHYQAGKLVFTLQDLNKSDTLSVACLMSMPSNTLLRTLPSSFPSPWSCLCRMSCMACPERPLPCTKENALCWVVQSFLSEILEIQSLGVNSSVLDSAAVVICMALSGFLQFLVVTVQFFAALESWRDSSPCVAFQCQMYSADALGKMLLPKSHCL